MDRSRFAVTYDYRCPFARNAHEHVVTALRADAPFDVHFLPFVLGGAYGAEGDPGIWDDPAQRPELTALAASIVVRDRFPEHFLDVHLALFDLRHIDGADLRDNEIVRGALDKSGVDSDVVYEELNQGWPYEELRNGHERAISDHAVFGVPTFIANDHAAFVRLMTRPDGDEKLATNTIEVIVNLLSEHVELNEFKHTSVPR